MDAQELRKDLTRFSTQKPPVKRAAYSDRTAWLMAIFSELAYTRFDEDNRNSLMTLASELAELVDRDVIAKKLKNLGSIIDSDNSANNDILRSILQIGDFELRCVLFDSSTDTQGFIAVRKSDDGLGMAVVSFRGTQQVRDWMTNLRADKIPVYSNSPTSCKTLGHVHKGFNEAFKSVERKIVEQLKDCKDIPIYITGHSLGGALATLATWYISGDKLAACYTFGAPRVGNDKLLNRFRTPIYRIVNGADPVPFIPPSGLFINCLKIAVRFIGIVITPLNHLADFLIRFQGYRHYGFQRYLSMCDEGADGTFPKLKNEFGIGSIERIFRYIRRLLRGEVSTHKRIDKYHDITVYRAKLREYAIRRQIPD